MGILFCLSLGLVLAATVDLDALFAGQLASNHQQGSGLTAMADRNLAQGLGVVNTALIQAQGSVSDDPGLIAALQTASRVPVQGGSVSDDPGLIAALQTASRVPVQGANDLPK